MIVLGSSDVGPSKYLSTLIGCGLKDVLCVSSNISRQEFGNAKFITIKDLDRIDGVELVVSGASIEEIETNVDKKIIRWANRNKIPSVAVIEHWSWYRKRFEVNERLLLPDYIIVNDEVALADAIEDGLPAERLRALGNPYLERLSKDRIDVENSDKQKLRYRIPLDKRIVVFVSEELRSVFTQASNDYLGYDEFSALKDVQSMLTPSDHLVIKQHPEENPQKYTELLCEHISIVDEVPITELVAIADVIIGMASMLLLELAIYRNDIVSFRPNATKSFIGERLGVTVDATSVSNLAEVIAHGCKAKSNFANRFSGSQDRIVNFLGDVKL